MIKLKQCPICSKKLLKQGLKNHIINQAESECFRKMNDLLTHHSDNFKEVSRSVLTRQMPHLMLWRRKLKGYKKFEL